MHADIDFANKLGIPADIHIISCGMLKGDTPAPAAELYTSSTFRRAYEFASSRGSMTGTGTAPMFILSAKHGLLHPDTIVDPYDFQLKDMTSRELDAWVDRIQVQLFEAGVRKANFHVHGGAVYVELMRRAVEPYGRVVNFFNPWREKQGREKGIGYRRGWYRRTRHAETAAGFHA